MSTFSVIIPTIARPTLRRTLDSFVDQLQELDEVIVVGDGPQPFAEHVVAANGGRVRYLEHGPTEDFGNAQRNFAMSAAANEYLAFMDDDDTYTTDAFSSMRKAVAEIPNRPLMFRMYHHAEVLWRTKDVRFGNVSTQMFVTPNIPARLGKWGEGYTGDFAFVSTTLEAWPGDALIWREEIIARLERHQKGGRL